MYNIYTFENMRIPINANMIGYERPANNEWDINDFKKWIDDGRPINHNIIKLNISNSNIETLGNLENLVNLTHLNCSSNQLISLEGIEKLINLRHLTCGHNQLISLEEIENLINLTFFHCTDNQLESLRGMENLSNLRYFDCSNNQLTSLEGISNLVNLKNFYYSTNNLILLEAIEISIKLIKNDKKMIHNMSRKVVYSDEHIELTNLFHALFKPENNDIIDQYIEEIEQMVEELNRSQKCVLK
jgi:Leucine-rich repeat (LRR) protein